MNSPSVLGSFGVNGTNAYPVVALKHCFFGGRLDGERLERCDGRADVRQLERPLIAVVVGRVDGFLPPPKVASF
jgi:hypothetical protein